jgi:uncharacterized protein (DUF488 family)
MTVQLRLMTIGHSTHTAERFVELLEQHSVSAVADVRSHPYSRHLPHFNREALRSLLRDNEIQYAFLGNELGARSKDPTCYVDGRVQYDRLSATKDFEDGIARVIAGARTERVALMCAEKEPLECHRTLLVARKLVDLNVLVDHILGDGSLEAHSESMLRLLEKTGKQPSLLDSTEDLVVAALAEQEARVAYVDPQLAAVSEQTT